MKLKTKHEILKDMKLRCEKTGENFEKYQKGGYLNFSVNELIALWEESYLMYISGTYEKLNKDKL